MIKALLFVLVFALFLLSCSACCRRRRRRRQPSPVHGKWGSWQPHFDISECRNGIIIQQRFCNNPTPAHGGDKCTGDGTRIQDCNECLFNNGGCQHDCSNTHGKYECHCHYGYRKAGDHNCIRITCKTSDWPTPQNGAKTRTLCLDGNEVDVGTICHVRCNAGYDIQGLSSTMCGIDGNWNNNPPICKAVTCNSIHVPDYGLVTPPECTANPKAGTVCTLSCTNDYSLIGYSGSKYETRCSSGGWTNPSNYYCKDSKKPVFSTCSREDILVNAGKMQTKAMVTWKPVQAQDNDGQVPVLTVYPRDIPPSATSFEFPEGRRYVTYTATDTSGNKESCSFNVIVKVLRCTEVYPISNGKMIPQFCSNLFGSKCSFECNEGYNLTGSTVRECIKTNGTVKWTGSNVACQRIRCNKLVEPKHTIMTGVGCLNSNPQYQTYCTFKCKTGYQVKSGSKIRTCKSNGKWSGDDLVCEMITCPALPVLSEALSISNHSCISQKSSFQDECRYTCGSGYILLGTSIKTCSSNGEWSPSGNPYCRDISTPSFNNCPIDIKKIADRNSRSTQVNWTIPTASDNAPNNPEVVRHGKQSGELFSEGYHKIRYTATDKAGNTAICTFQIIIQVITCSALQTPPRGSMQCTNRNIYGSECNFGCNIGYALKGSKNRTCEKDNLTGKWTGHSTYCEAILCPYLDSPVNGFKSACRKNTFGEKCLFYCNIGSRVVNGSSSRTCLENGTWSGSPLICEGITCPAITLPSNEGIILNECNRETGYRVTCRIVCRSGYQMVGTEVRTCLLDGRWNDNSNASCKDIELPRFTTSCPFNIAVFAEENKNYAQVSFPLMSATDNSGELPIISVDGNKTNYTAGRHQITITATDSSGNKASCRFYIEVKILHCYPHPPYIINGRFVGVCRNTYGSTCHFVCNDGYNMTGSNTRVCKAKQGQIQGYWSGTMPFCSINRCPPLTRPKNGYLYPPACFSSNGPVIDTMCIFGCHNGYSQSSGNNVMTCGKNSRWDKDVDSIIKCQDKIKPVFTKSCPSNIRIPLDHNGTATANWTIPVAEDNSRIPPTITVRPVDAIPPYTVNKTTTEVEYYARDEAGNTGQCSFKIVAEDNLGPRVAFCPPSQVILATKMAEYVTWDPPRFVDNSNIEIIPKCNRQPGSFYWGVWSIHCRGYDNNPNNNPAFCSFNITVKPRPCPSLTPPINGAKACDTWMFGRFCTPNCNIKYDFAVTIATGTMWVCGASGIWLPSSKLPDCSKIHSPDNANRAASLLYYFSGDCNNATVQLEIKRNFISILNQSHFSEICRATQMRDRCSIVNVEVECGVTSRRRRSEEFMSEVLRRNRRSVPSGEMKVHFEFSLSINSTDDASNKSQIESSISSASSKMDTIENEVKQLIKNGSLQLNISGNVIRPVNNSFSTTTTSFKCNVGQIFLDKKCVSCPVGTYHNVTLDKCIDCSEGWYQDKEGQKSCFACPVGMSTVETKSINDSYCKAYCGKGTYSPTGLEPCIPCEKGLYQSNVGKSKCTSCPNNKTTHTTGAKSSSNCSAACKPGSFSQNGLEPCRKCDKQSYQPNSESTSCVMCSGTKTTMNEGSISPLDCQEINECDSSPCRNGSNCIDLINDFFCQCQEGYTGKKCEHDFDDCASLPCQNNATCHDHLKNFTCTCAAGFTGSVCQTDIDECSVTPCLNNATCFDLIGRYKCYCQPGYEGDTCERDTNECQPNPCLHGGTCIDQQNAFSCRCADGFDGPTCEENIDDCSKNLCANGSACIDLVNNYTCSCLPGYTGFYCDHEINECKSNPCQHNGTCYNTIGSFTCACPVGYNGSTCESEINECLSNPCLNGATCLDAIGSFSCRCASGYQGENCEDDIDECAYRPCSNNASCMNTKGSFACNCKLGFTGYTCNAEKDNCLSGPCFNNGSCINKRGGFTCQCQDGFIGQRCQVDIDECSGNPCKNNGTCHDGINDYKCVCSTGFTGNDCTMKIGYCEVNPCENNGECLEMSTDYKCNCSSGYTGRNCSSNINECSSQPCLNNGTCQDLVNGFWCSCLPGFSGIQCQDNIDDCKNDACMNNSTCVDGMDTYKCVCQEGFKGTFCEVEVRPCDSFPCYNNGICTNKGQQYLCSCPPGFTGHDCHINIDDCKPSNPCQNNGTCTDLVSNYTCACPAGFYGQHCENITDHCINSNCSEHGECTNLPLGFKCNCSASYYGPFCKLQLKPCASSPCRNGATCVNTNNEYNCSCKAGFTGETCHINIDECQGNKCLNNATCIDQVNGYWCLCWDGFNGTHCEHQLYSCKDNPCMNNGTCVDIFGGYKCQCTERFGGLRCEADKSACKFNPCLNGGTCHEQNITSFNCTCSPGFQGFTCDKNIDDCASSPCPLHSDCKDKVNGYECKCHQSHTGKQCETAITDNFDLLFQDKSDTSSVELRDRKSVPTMIGFTILFWVKPNIRHKNGTIFTYMVPESKVELVEISFTADIIQILVRNYILQHENEILDGKWHLIGVSWSREENSFNLYVDGKRARALYLPSGPPLNGSGFVILGQKYSWIKRKYIASDSFVGILHQVNIWKFPANEIYMWNAAHKCSWPLGGDVNSWIGFMFNTRGNVMRKFPSSCKALELCMKNCTHIIDCSKVGGDMVCRCQKGFTGQLCDVNIDDCVSNPCVNGRCEDDIASYRCICHKGFYGDRCEKRLISTSKECPLLPKLQNGDVLQKTYSGKHLVNLKCHDGYSFKAVDVTSYSCGPETDWKWNRQEKIKLPRCLSTSEPIGIRQKYEIAIPFNPSICRTVEQYDRLKSSLKQGFMNCISYLEEHKCFLYERCRIEKVNAPRCEQLARRERRSLEDNLKINFEIAFLEWGNSSQHSSVTENAEAVAFQLHYAVSVGNFTMMIDGTPVKPRSSSLKLLLKSHECKDGYITSYDNSSCVACPVGTRLHSNFKECVRCSFGYYQNMEGKMLCNKCPEGYSTKTQGSTTKEQCYKELETSTSQWKYIVPVLIFLIVVAVLIIAICLWKKRKLDVKFDKRNSTMFKRPQQARASKDNFGYDQTRGRVQPGEVYDRLQRQHGGARQLQKSNIEYYNIPQGYYQNNQPIYEEITEITRHEKAPKYENPKLLLKPLSNNETHEKIKNTYKSVPTKLNPSPQKGEAESNV